MYAWRRGKRPWRERAPSFGEGALSLQASLSHRELPPRAPAHAGRKFGSLRLVRVLVGEVFWLIGEARTYCRVRLLHSVCLWNTIRWDTLCECRDSACRRPFGVRRNVAGVCSEMTPVGFYTCLPLLVCRDPACRRPFGVRLRGNHWFYRLIFGICAAPLRMTRKRSDS